MIFISTADIAEGKATMGEVKWDVAKTTPRDEFCMPTCIKLMSSKKIIFETIGWDNSSHTNEKKE